MARALSLEPRDRFENCKEFVEALRSVLKPATPEFVLPEDKKYSSSASATRGHSPWGSAATASRASCP